MKVVNEGAEDFHIHTSTFSDGFNSVDEIVGWAGKIGLKTIALTDHCQLYLDRQGYGKKTNRIIASRWKNVHNDVKVIFGVEADLVNEEGDVSFDIQGKDSEFVILSAHKGVYLGNPAHITAGYVRAIERFGDRIAFIGHICAKYFDKEIDVDPIIDAALRKGIAFELDCANLAYGLTNLEKLKKVLARAEKLYVNSDAHTPYELQELRKEGLRFLKSLCLI